MDNFTISLDKICFLIERAHEFEDKGTPTEIGGDETHLEDPDLDDLDGSYSDPIQDELASFFENLNQDEELDLVALMWIGRGTYEVDDWVEAREVAEKEATQSTAEYLLGTPLLAEHLENGLEAFGLSCAD